MNTFDYDTLDFDTAAFRLIFLKAGAVSQPIECELVQAIFDIDYIPDYEALSYAWSATQQSETIWINGSTFPVTPSLASILNQMRHQGEDRILWIDAICINQQNNPERGHQVRQMDRIYKRAYRVIFWLGPLTTSIDILMESLEDLQKQVPGEAWQPKDERWRIHWQHTQKKRQGTHLEQQQALQEILRRPWFRRVWILQEVANARAALVHCGHRAVSARIFALSPHLLELSLDKHCQAVFDVLPGPSRKQSWWNQERDLYSLLSKFSGAHASLEHDRIYALFGMCSENTRNITIDYDRPIEGVIDSTIAYICGFQGSDESKVRYRGVTEFTNNLRGLQNRVLISLLKSDGANANVQEFFRKNRRYITTTGELIAATTKSLMHGENLMSCMLHEEQIAGNEALRSLKKTGLLAAAKNGHEGILRLLLHNGADWKHQDESGQTALLEASRNGHEGVVQLLLDKGADWEHQDESGRTALLEASRNGHEGVVQLLLDKGADWKHRDESGRTALLEASTNGHEGVVQLLLDKGADWEHQDESGRTALLEASRNGHEGVVQLLLDKGADWKHQDRSGWTALLEASTNGHEGVVQLLHRLQRLR